MDRSRVRAIALALFVLGFALTVGTSAVFFYDASQADTIARGVSVGGIDVGGLSLDAARSRLISRLAPRLERPVTLVHRAQRFTLTPEAIDLHADVKAMVEAARKRSRSGNVFSRFLREARDRSIHASLPALVSYDADALTRHETSIARRLDQAERPARIEPSGTGLHLVRSRPGLQVRSVALSRALQVALAAPSAVRLVTIPTRVRQPRPTTGALARRYPWFITISRGQKRLRLFHRLRLSKTYTIAVGRIGLATPAGLYHIEDKQVNPAWHVPKSSWAGALAGRVIPPGPDDPLKARWLGFFDGAGIHGTDDLASLGTAASHGCIRMSIPDVIQLYNLVPLRTPIDIS